MTELISPKEIREEGFKLETNSSFIKGKKRYIKCNSCGCWNLTTNQPDGNKLINYICEWCKKGGRMKILK